MWREEKFNFCKKKTKSTNWILHIGLRRGRFPTGHLFLLWVSITQMALAETVFAQVAAAASKEHLVLSLWDIGHQNTSHDVTGREMMQRTAKKEPFGKVLYLCEVTVQIGMEQNHVDGRKQFLFTFAIFPASVDQWESQLLSNLDISLILGAMHRTTRRASWCHWLFIKMDEVTKSRKWSQCRSAWSLYRLEWPVEGDSTGCKK